MIFLKKRPNVFLFDMISQSSVFYKHSQERKGELKKRLGINSKEMLISKWKLVKEDVLSSGTRPAEIW